VGGGGQTEGVVVRQIPAQEKKSLKSASTDLQGPQDRPGTSDGETTAESQKSGANTPTGGLRGGEKALGLGAGG